MKDKTGRPQSEMAERRNYFDLEKRSRYIPADTIKTVMIVNSAITTTKVADSAVSTTKLADDSVTLDKVAPDVVAEMIKYAIVLGG